jgi:16S rRNA C967 or C1407 C5-methylase (RsmB/RsmF family)
MVYSTCTFDPIQNEAVVAELLRRNPGSLELVDVSAALPGLIRRPGLTTWAPFIMDHGAMMEVEQNSTDKQVHLVPLRPLRP